MIVRLLTEHHLEFLCLKGGCTGLCESTHVKMPHCWKSHVTAHNYVYCTNFFIRLDTILHCIYTHKANKHLVTTYA